jgi:hypothetical protein
MGSLAFSTLVRAQNRAGVQHCVSEWSYSSGKAYKDPFNDIDLDFIFVDPQGREQRVPAFWDGEQTWRVRYTPHSPGRYSYRSVCGGASNQDLHGRAGSLDVLPYQGANPLYVHGPLRVAADHRHFEYSDGTPFFWLGDTWWMALCKRLHGLRFPIVGMIAEKGVTVILSWLASILTCLVWSRKPTS